MLSPVSSVRFGTIFAIDADNPSSSHVIATELARNLRTSPFVSERRGWYQVEVWRRRRKSGFSVIDTTFAPDIPQAKKMSPNRLSLEAISELAALREQVAAMHRLPWERGPAMEKLKAVMRQVHSSKEPVSQVSLTFPTKPLASMAREGTFTPWA